MERWRFLRSKSPKTTRRPSWTVYEETKYLPVSFSFSTAVDVDQTFSELGDLSSDCSSWSPFYLFSTLHTHRWFAAGLDLIFSTFLNSYSRSVLCGPVVCRRKSCACCTFTFCCCLSTIIFLYCLSIRYYFSKLMVCFGSLGAM